MTQLVRYYVKASEIGKDEAYHLFRHAHARERRRYPFYPATARTRRFIDDADLHTGCHPQAESSEAKGRQGSIHTATHLAKVGNTVLEELKDEIAEKEAEECGLPNAKQ